MMMKFTARIINKREDYWVSKEETARLPWVESRSDHLLQFVYASPEFKSSAVLSNNQLVASCQLWCLILLCYV